MVIDTMIFAYAIFGETYKKKDSRDILAKANQLLVPDLFFPEFTNTVWQWVMHKNIPVIIALNALNEATGLINRVIETKPLTQTALFLALERNHSVYDSFFIAIAIKNNTKVVSYDKKLLRSFPEYSIHPRVFLNKIN